MRRLLPLLVLLASLAPNVIQAGEIEDQLRRLGSTELQLRLRAEADLIQRGRTILPELEALAEAADPEIRRAAESIISRIIWGEIPQPLIQRAERFLNDDANEISFASLCEGAHGLQISLILLDRLQANPELQRACCLQFLKFFADSAWAREPSNFAKLSPSVQAPLLEALLLSDRYQPELARQWWLEGEISLSELARWSHALTIRSDWVFDILSHLILDKNQDAALAFADACSASSVRYLSAWADLYLKTRGTRIDTQWSLEKTAALQRAMGETDTALKSAKQLPETHPFRIEIEELHGDWSDLHRHAQLASEFSSLRSPRHQLFLLFLKTHTVPEDLESLHNPTSETWFSDLEVLASMGDFREIRRLTAGIVDRIPFWLQATALEGLNKELDEKLKQPEILSVKSCQIGAKLLHSQGNHQAAETLLLERAKILDPSNDFDRLKIAESLVTQASTAAAFQLIAPPEEIADLYACCLSLFPRQAKQAQFWAQLLLNEGPCPELWLQVQGILDGKITLEQSEMRLQAAHAIDDFDQDASLACLALLKNRTEPISRTQRWVEAKLLVKTLAEEKTATDSSIEALLNEARYWSEQAQHDRAIELSGALLNLAPPSAKIHLEHSLNLGSAGQPTTSLTHAKLAGQLTLGRPSAYLDLSESFLARGLGTEAQLSLRTLLRFSRLDNPATAQAVRREASLLASEGQFQAAAHLRALELIKVTTTPAAFQSLSQYHQLARDYLRWSEQAKE